MTTAVTIATWNVNSIRARLPLVLAWLREAMPDVVLFQETKVEDHLFPREPLEDLGYNLAIWGQKSYNGVAILSRHPLEDIQVGLQTGGHGGMPENSVLSEARYIEAFTAGFRVASIYAPNGQEVGSEKYCLKEHFYAALTEKARGLLTYGECLVLGGDYNIAPRDADVEEPEAWKEKILCSTPERSWYRRLLYLGFVDPLDRAAPDGVFEAPNTQTPTQTLTQAPLKNPYTWWDYRHQGFQKNKGLRIDHVLLSPEAADCLEATSVASKWRAFEKASDHVPVMGVFRS